jgi:hypothetical protein
MLPTVKAADATIRSLVRPQSYCIAFAPHIEWVETYYVVPAGLDRGGPVRLTDAQKQTMRAIYDGGEYLELTGPLAAYVALLHVCGYEAVQPWSTPPAIAVDIFTAWSATGPKLKDVLRLDGESIVCTQLKTRYPAAAA